MVGVLGEEVDGGSGDLALGDSGDETADADSTVAKKGLITNPRLEAPFAVRFSVSTYDFGTGGPGGVPATEREEVAE